MAPKVGRAGTIINRYVLLPREDYMNTSRPPAPAPNSAPPYIPPWELSYDHETARSNLEAWFRQRPGTNLFGQMSHFPKQGLDFWGFEIYRTVYRKSRRWSNYMDYLHMNVFNYFSAQARLAVDQRRKEQRRAIMFRYLYPLVSQHRELLEGASAEVVQELFQSAPIHPSNGRSCVRYCLHVDEQCLEIFQSLSDRGILGKNPMSEGRHLFKIIGDRKFEPKSPSARYIKYFDTTRANSEDQSLDRGAIALKVLNSVPKQDASPSHLVSIWPLLSFNPRYQASEDQTDQVHQRDGKRELEEPIEVTAERDAAQQPQGTTTDPSRPRKPRLGPSLMDYMNKDPEEEEESSLEELQESVNLKQSIKSRPDESFPKESLEEFERIFGEKLQQEGSSPKPSKKKKPKKKPTRNEEHGIASF